MIIKRSPSFRRMYRKLSSEQRKKAAEALVLFEQNPSHHRLHNHKLSGTHKGLRAISAGYDLRLVYREIDGHITVLFVGVGTHDAVY